MGRTVCKTVPCYILSLIRGTAITSRWSVTVGSRQLFITVIPRALPSVTTASLSIAFQAIPLHVLEDNNNNSNNNNNNINNNNILSCRGNHRCLCCMSLCDIPSCARSSRCHCCLCCRLKSIMSLLSSPKKHNAPVVVKNTASSTKNQKNVKTSVQSQNFFVYLHVVCASTQATFYIYLLATSQYRAFSDI